ncbi:MAG: hypothetical protein H7308_09615 [Chthonomonadaceae bacterium]|nr:hypothetical protein [Chthonomonadaceae bacterium]
MKYNEKEEDAVPEGYTPEQLAQFLEWTRAHPYGDQDENGVDFSRLRANLKLTPTERVEKRRRAARGVKEMKNAGIRAGLQPHSKG